GEEFIFDSILTNVKMSLVCDALADEYGLTVSEDTTAVIDAYLEDFIEEYSGGSKTQFNQALAQYGINLKMLREIYLRDERGMALYDYLYGSGGTIGISDEDRTEYLTENYVRVRHIYVNNKYIYATDEDGIVLTNKDGTYQTAALTGELLDAQNAKIASIDAALAAGEDFETVCMTYSEDTLYENGYYLTRTMDFVDDVVVSAFDLEIGKHVKIESEVGTHYIMRLDMDDKPWDDEKNADFFADYDTVVSTALFTEYVESLIDEVVVNEEILSKFSVQASPSNSRF
ncbi:MAG: peptidylprolyl isomerase, partial [Clostridia bacterium]|nr:peptidylprolyl isomerase [Clostridia bacterium]